MIPDLVHPVLLAASKAKPTSSSGSLIWIFLLVIAVAGYFFWLRPQQQRQRKQRTAQSDIHEGDEVVTVGGIVGRVIEMQDDRVHLLTGYHTTAGATEHLPHRMTFVRNAIARKAEPVDPEPVTNGSGEIDDFSFEHDEDVAEHDEDADGAFEATAEAGGYAEDGTGDAEPENPARGTGTTNGSTPRSGRGRRAGGGAGSGGAPDRAIFHGVVFSSCFSIARTSARAMERKCTSSGPSTIWR